MGTRFCSSCGKPIDESALFCAHCGAKQGAPGQAPPAAAPAPGPYAPVPPPGKPPKKVWPLVTALSVVAVAVVAVLALMLTGVIKLGGAAPVVANPTPVATSNYVGPVFTPAQQTNTSSIVGLWQYMDPEDYTVYYMQFDNNGACSLFTSEDPEPILADYKYYGSTLELIPVSEEGETVYLTVFMGANGMTLTSSNGESQTFTRITG
jgi:hypothetical protein